MFVCSCHGLRPIYPLLTVTYVPAMIRAAPSTHVDKPKCTNAEPFKRFASNFVRSLSETMFYMKIIPFEKTSIFCGKIVRRKSCEKSNEDMSLKLSIASDIRGSHPRQSETTVLPAQTIRGEILGEDALKHVSSFSEARSILVPVS